MKDNLPEGISIKQEGIMVDGIGVPWSDIIALARYGKNYFATNDKFIRDFKNNQRDRLL